MNEIFDIFIALYLYDIEVLTTPWVYYTVIPAVFYSMFMIVKWTFLTIPIWVPLASGIKVGKG